MDFACSLGAPFDCAFPLHRVSSFVALGFECEQPNLIAINIVAMSNNALSVLNAALGFNLHLLASLDWL
jgi:hypothetical protein